MAAYDAVMKQMQADTEATPRKHPGWWDTIKAESNGVDNPILTTPNTMTGPCRYYPGSLCLRQHSSECVCVCAM